MSEPSKHARETANGLDCCECIPDDLKAQRIQEAINAAVAEAVAEWRDRVTELKAMLDEAEARCVSLRSVKGDLRLHCEKLTDVCDSLKLENEALKNKNDADLNQIIARAEKAERGLAECRVLLKDFASNWDCDKDAHKYGTPCRACEAQNMLNKP